ncbi:hypothetical protein M514_07498 [Trichuris suis]|uniref:Mos1 transposase HTH domain-containing protein n=1 Tax=Trichuris suis TaxID=68888 RepID=A0A085NE61_9BILA|nr:hypothetical protein M513_07498 [Trichuris suis]KFD67757.1 hypothetical protein M514_07498 [Trichuris suis]
MDGKAIRGLLLYKFKSGHSTREATHNINATFGQRMISKSSAARWFRRFASGDERLEDANPSGQRTDIDNDALKELVELDPTVTVRQMASKLCLSTGAIVTHLKRTGKVKKQDRWVNVTEDANVVKQQKPKS